MDVGVVGLGVMGSAMARHLAREGLLKPYGIAQHPERRRLPKR